MILWEHLILSLNLRSFGTTDFVEDRCYYYARETPHPTRIVAPHPRRATSARHAVQGAMRGDSSAGTADRKVPSGARSTTRRLTLSKVNPGGHPSGSYSSGSSAGTGEGVRGRLRRAGMR